MGHPAAEPRRRTSDRQRQFDVESAAADFPATPRHRATTRYFTELKCKLSSWQRGHEQMPGRGHGCKWLVHGRRPTHIGGALSPEDNDAPEVGWFTTSPHRIGLAMFHNERNAA
jgi:hypothetical protein